MASLRQPWRDDTTRPRDGGGFLVAMRDTNSDGRADVISRFGPDAQSRNGGGTGIGIYNGSLYAEEGDTVAKRIVRYALATDSLTPSAKSETIVSGLPVSGGHPMHPFAIGQSGDLYMNSGSSPTRARSRSELTSLRRTAMHGASHSSGDLALRRQQDEPALLSAERYATGIRNPWHRHRPAGQVYATQHGRDQLAENWPKLYTPEKGQNLPAEELLKLEQGGDYGWPYCYYDDAQRKLVLAPEYGGDGGKAVGDCASKKGPTAFFPAHWAQDGLVFYTGTAFPEKYRGGAFIAFHGSWNRAPGPQGGYNVVFVPFTGGNPADPSRYEVFADGFAGANKQPDAAAHRPTGITQGPDGALYVTDDKAGRVWRIVYRGTGQ